MFSKKSRTRIGATVSNVYLKGGNSCLFFILLNLSVSYFAYDELVLLCNMFCQGFCVITFFPSGSLIMYNRRQSIWEKHIFKLLHIPPIQCCPKEWKFAGLIHTEVVNTPKQHWKWRREVFLKIVCPRLSEKVVAFWEWLLELLAVVSSLVVYSREGT